MNRYDEWTGACDDATWYRRTGSGVLLFSAFCVLCGITSCTMHPDPPPTAMEQRVNMCSGATTNNKQHADAIFRTCMEAANNE